jgi:hypothetical protein
VRHGQAQIGDARSKIIIETFHAAGQLVGIREATFFGGPLGGLRGSRRGRQPAPWPSPPATVRRGPSFQDFSTGAPGQRCRRARGRHSSTAPYQSRGAIGDHEDLAGRRADKSSLPAL